jgi:uncharacterized membrane protein
MTESNSPRLDPLWHVETTLLLVIAMQLGLAGYLYKEIIALLVVLELILLVGLRLFTPRQHVFDSPARRLFVTSLIALISLVNVSSLIHLVQLILFDRTIRGPYLIISGLNVAITNLMVFALWYWEMDGGGPGKRRRKNGRPRDFLFTPMANPGVAEAGWFPTFIDYVYVSATNALAFSPTDTMPITRRAKVLMLVQSLISLSTIALVVARAVNILA